MRYNSYGTGTASDHCWALIRPWALLTETPLTAGRFWNSTGWMSLQWCCYPQAGATKILMHQKRFPCSHHSETTAAARWSTDAMRFEHLHINAAKMITDQGNQCLNCYGPVCTVQQFVHCCSRTWNPGALCPLIWSFNRNPMEMQYFPFKVLLHVHHVQCAPCTMCTMYIPIWRTWKSNLYFICRVLFHLHCLYWYGAQCAAHRNTEFLHCIPTTTRVPSTVCTDL